MSEVIPVLGEHQAPVKEDPSVNSAGYSPSADELKAIKLINKLFSKAKKHRDKYDQKWMDYYRMFRGKQWKEERPSYRHSAVINLVFRAIQSQVPILSDTLPRFDFLPENPEDLELSQILNELAESDWTRKNWLMQFCESLLDSHLYGTAFGGMFWDYEGADGTGETEHESIDPFYCFPDPDAHDMNGKRTRYFIYAEPIEVEILRSQYPDKKQFIKPDMIELVENSDKTDIHTTRFRSPADNSTIIEGSTETDNQENTKALKITLWYKDPSVETKEEQGEDGQISYVQKKKYPRGRKIVIANSVLLEDVENEYEDGKFPFARLVNYPLSREFWGISELEQLEGPQIIYNKIISFTLDVLTLMGNPIWVVDNTSGIDTDNLFNRPGLIVEKNAGTEARREEGVQLQPYVLSILDRIKSDFDDVAGSEDVSRGVKPDGVTAAKAIEALQETAQTRLRQKSRMIDAYFQELGQLWLSRVFQYVTVPRVYRLTNNPESQKYFKFSIEGDDQGQKYAKVREFIEQEDGTMSYGDERQYQIQGNFDVKVSTGSALPFAKTEKLSIGFQLFDRGAIDAEELLTIADWPNKEKVMARIAEQQQAQAMAQAEQGALQTA
jgi:hypothetical protein